MANDDRLKPDFSIDEELVKPRIRYEYWQSETDGEWRWRARAFNAEIVGGSAGESYKDKRDCLHAIDLFRSSAGAKVVEVKE